MLQNKKLTNYKNLFKLYENGKIFVAFDTETTSLTPSTGRIIEIGSVKFSKDGVIDTWSCLFNPQQIIPQLITNITNITNSMVENKPFIQTELHKFINFIQGTILIGHNVQFDLNFLNFECENSNLTKTHNNVIDTLEYSKWAYPNFKSHKLAFLADELKLDKGQSHRAQSDANACMELFLRIINDTNN